MRRPPKPRFQKPRLTWRWDARKSIWQPYHRVTWRIDGKKREKNILLKWEGDAEKLDHLYWSCESGSHEAQSETKTQYTWKSIVIEWRKDPRIQGKLADSTKKSYRITMDAFLEKNGDKAMKNTTRQGVRAMHEYFAATPRKADKFVQVISMLWNYAAKKKDWPLGENPAEGIDLFGKQREYEPWPEWLVAQLVDADPVVRGAAELILGTGQRPTAAIQMKRSDFSGDYMRVSDEKGDEQFEIYCPERLRAFLQQTPNAGRFILAKNLNQGLGYNAVEHRFRRWRKSLGDNATKYTLHGLRKLAIIQLAESGATDAEIQAITNQSAEMVAYYRKKASRKILSRNAIKRAERNKNET